MDKISYIAGIIDGEGCITIGRVKSSKGNFTYYVKLTVHMQKLEAIKIISKYFNKDYSISVLNGKRYYSFYSTKDNLENILKKIIPYLQVKKEEARLGLKLIESHKKHKTEQNRKGGKFMGNKPVPKRIQDYRKRLYIKCKELKKVSDD